MKPKGKYRRCKKCRELVRDPDNCENCANKDPLALARRNISEGRRSPVTLDTQEGNWEEWN